MFDFADPSEELLLSGEAADCYYFATGHVWVSFLCNGTARTSITLKPVEDTKTM